MILEQLKQVIAECGSVTGKELARRFSLSEDGVDAMLGIWIRKGVICRFVDTNASLKVTRVRYALTPARGIALTVTFPTESKADSSARGF